LSLERIVQYVAQQAAAGLGLEDQRVVATIAEQIGRDLQQRGGVLDQPMPRINPDRRYQIGELEQYGYKKGRFYKAHKHLIRKDGRKSYVLGLDLLLLNENAPTLASHPPKPQPMRRPRGRPTKKSE